MACVLSSNVNDDTKTTHKTTFLYVYDHKEWSENLRYESDCNVLGIATWTAKKTARFRFAVWRIRSLESIIQKEKKEDEVYIIWKKRKKLYIR